MIAFMRHAGWYGTPNCRGSNFPESEFAPAAYISMNTNGDKTQSKISHNSGRTGEVVCDTWKEEMKQAKSSIDATAISNLVDRKIKRR